MIAQHLHLNSPVHHPPTLTERPLRAVPLQLRNAELSKTARSLLKMAQNSDLPHRSTSLSARNFALTERLTEDTSGRAQEVSGAKEKQGTQS